MTRRTRPGILDGSKIVLVRSGNEIRVLCNRLALRSIGRRIDWMLTGGAHESFDLHLFWDMNSGDVFQSPVVRGGVGPEDISLAFSEASIMEGPDVSIQLLPDSTMDSVFESASCMASVKPLPD